MTQILQRLGVVAALVLVLAALTGCSAAEEELAAAYQQGYEDGVAAAEDDAEHAGEDAELDAGDCSDCYALGWDEGYAQGYADGAADG